MQSVEGISEFVKKTIKHGKKVVGLPGINEYAIFYTNEFYKAWEAAGGTVLGDYQMDYSKEADFFTPVSKAIADKPDVIFIGGPSQITALVIKQAREMGFEGAFVAMDSTKIDEVEDLLPLELLEGYVGLGSVKDYGDVPIFEMIGRTQEGAKAFPEKFKAAYPDTVQTPEHTLNYTTAHLLFKAMEEAGSIDAKEIRANGCSYCGPAG
jgi:branched-chain amino acid transport system substrate-binding protein